MASWSAEKQLRQSRLINSNRFMAWWGSGLLPCRAERGVYGKRTCNTVLPEVCTVTTGSRCVLPSWGKENQEYRTGSPGGFVCIVQRKSPAHHSHRIREVPAKHTEHLNSFSLPNSLTNLAFRVMYVMHREA